MQLTFTTIRRFFTLTTLICALFAPQASALSFSAARPVITRKKACTCTYGQLCKGLLRLAYRKKGKIAGTALVAGAIYFAWQYWNKPEAPQPTSPTPDPNAQKPATMTERMAALVGNEHKGEGRGSIANKLGLGANLGSAAAALSPIKQPVEARTSDSIDAKEQKETNTDPSLPGSKPLQPLTDEQKKQQAEARAKLQAALKARSEQKNQPK